MSAAPAVVSSALPLVLGRASLSAEPSGFATSHAPPAAASVPSSKSGVVVVTLPQGSGAVPSPSTTGAAAPAASDSVQVGISSAAAVAAAFPVTAPEGTKPAAAGLAAAPLPSMPAPRSAPGSAAAAVSAATSQALAALPPTAVSAGARITQGQSAVTQATSSQPQQPAPASHATAVLNSTLSAAVPTTAPVSGVSPAVKAAAGSVSEAQPGDGAPPEPEVTNTQSMAAPAGNSAGTGGDTEAEADEDGAEGDLAAPPSRREQRYQNGVAQRLRRTPETIESKRVAAIRKENLRREREGLRVRGARGLHLLPCMQAARGGGLFEELPTVRNNHSVGHACSQAK